jgi:hypothetical protein
MTIGMEGDKTAGAPDEAAALPDDDDANKAPDDDETGKPIIDEPTGPALESGPDEFDKQADDG